MATAYYNEIDPFAAEWLRQLIAAGHIAPGVVDEKSIEDIKPDELKQYKQCHFFAGIGVWSHALRLAGWPDERPVWTGSCPCQPFSSAGTGKGFSDERHLWPAFNWLIGKRRPVTIFGEQVANGDGKTWLDLVQSDLALQNYTLGAVSTVACGFGAPHKRQRLYWVGHSKHPRPQRFIQPTADIKEPRRVEARPAGPSDAPSFCNGAWSDFEESTGNGYCKPVQPGTYPLVDGAPKRVGRLRGYGNAIVAPQAEEFIKAYMEVSSETPRGRGI